MYRQINEKPISGLVWPKNYYFLNKYILGPAVVDLYKTPEAFLAKWGACSWRAVRRWFRQKRFSPLLVLMVLPTWKDLARRFLVPDDSGNETPMLRARRNVEVMKFEMWVRNNFGAPHVALGDQEIYGKLVPGLKACPTLIKKRKDGRLLMPKSCL